MAAGRYWLGIVADAAVVVSGFPAGQLLNAVGLFSKNTLDPVPGVALYRNGVTATASFGDESASVFTVLDNTVACPIVAVGGVHISGPTGSTSIVLLSSPRAGFGSAIVGGDGSGQTKFLETGAVTV